MTTILNGYSETADDALRDRPGNQCLFRYVGNIFKKLRNPSVLFEGLRLACEDKQFARDVRVEFVGSMRGFEFQFAEWGIDGNAQHLGFRSRDEAQRLMASADVLILLQSISGLGDDVISGKAYEHLAVGVPTLAVTSRGGGDAWLIEQTHGGLVVGNDDARQVAEGFHWFWNQWREGRLRPWSFSGDLGRFSRDAATSQLAALFDHVLGET